MAPSSSLVVDLYIAENVHECGTLVYLHAFERMRSAALAEKVLDVLDSNSQMAQVVDDMVPGVRMRLRERPTDALEDLRSLRVLLKLVEYVDPRAMERLRGFARDMVKQHTRVFGSFDGESEHVLDMLPESPMWASLVRYMIDTIGYHMLIIWRDGEVYVPMHTHVEMASC